MKTSAWRIEGPRASSLPAWRRMRQALWPEMTRKENLSETKAMVAAESRFFIRVALDAQGRAAGFAEAALRTDSVNGCATSPVIFLEGIYVEPRVRRQGVARALVGAVEQWGRKVGCLEFASDALLENTSSHSMHRGLGFEETERVVYFRKEIARMQPETRVKPHDTLEALLARCDPTAPTDEDRTWIELPPVGGEL